MSNQPQQPKVLDVSNEEYRVYTFVRDGQIYFVTIREPLQIIAGSDGHRLVDNGGENHFVPNGWIHLRWRVKTPVETPPSPK